MKLKLLPFLLLLGNSVFGQYQVELSNETYTELTGATDLTYDPSQGGYYHAMNLTFPSFRRTADFSLQPSIPSLGAYITDKGYLAVYEKPGYLNTIVFHCLFANQFNQVAGVTTVSAKLEGTAPNRIAKVQWKDLVYGGNNAQTANFQAWLHENSGDISYHYGPNTLPAPTTLSSYVGTLVLNDGFSAVIDQFSLTGSPTSKQTTKGYTTMTFPPMTGAPANGAVITLKRFYTSIDEAGNASQATIYPNPATDVLYVPTPGTQSSRISIITGAGAEVFRQVYEPGTAIIPLQQFAAGLYFVQVQSGETVTVNKLVVSK